MHLLGKSLHCSDFCSTNSHPGMAASHLQAGSFFDACFASSRFAQQVFEIPVSWNFTSWFAEAHQAQNRKTNIAFDTFRCQLQKCKLKKYFEYLRMILYYTISDLLWLLVIGLNLWYPIFLAPWWSVNALLPLPMHGSKAPSSEGKLTSCKRHWPWKAAGCVGKVYVETQHLIFQESMWPDF